MILTFNKPTTLSEDLHFWFKLNTMKVTSEQVNEVKFALYEALELNKGILQTLDLETERMKSEIQPMTVKTNFEKRVRRAMSRKGFDSLEEAEEYVRMLDNRPCKHKTPKIDLFRLQLPKGYSPQKTTAIMIVTDNKVHEFTIGRDAAKWLLEQFGFTSHNIANVTLNRQLKSGKTHYKGWAAFRK